MKRLAHMLSVIAVLVLVLPTVSSVGARADSEKGYVWCNVAGTDLQTGGRRAYFSDVFPDQAAGGYTQAFRNYVAANYARVLGPVSCSSNPELGEARSDRDAAKASSMSTVVDTGWTY
jgi:hypothetical protein